MEAVAADSHLLHSVCLYSEGCDRELSFVAFCVFVQWRQWPRTLICWILCVCAVEAVAADSHLLHFVCSYSGGSGRGRSFVAFCVFVQRRQWPRTLICCILCVCTVEAVAANYLKLYSLCLYSGGSGRGLPFIVFSVFVVATHSHLLHFVCLYSGCCGRGLSFAAFCVFVQWRLWPRTLIYCILCVCTVEAVAADSHLLHYVCLYSGGSGRGLLFVAFCVFVQWRQWPSTLISCILSVYYYYLLHFVCLYSGGSGRGLSFVAFCVFLQWRLWPRTILSCILCVCTVEAVAADSHLLYSLCLYSGGSGRGLLFVALCVFVQWRQWPRTLISCILSVYYYYLLHFVCLYSGGSGADSHFLHFVCLLLLFVAFCVFVQRRQWPRTLICCILCISTVEAVAANYLQLYSLCLYSGGSGRGLPFIALCVFLQWRQWPRPQIGCILCVCTVEAVATHSHLLHFVCLYSGCSGRGLSFVAFCVFVQWRLWPRTLICCILCVCTVEAVAADSHLLHYVCLYSGGCGRKLLFVVFVCLYSGGSGHALSFVAFCVFVQ